MNRAASVKAPEAMPEPVARIVVSFGGPLTADASIVAEHVSPGQLYLAAWLLESFAREVRAGMVAPAASKGLVGAPRGILVPMRRRGEG